MAIENLAESNIWDVIFTHTPAPLRWVFGVMTLGLFTLAGMLWKWNRDDMQRVYERIDKIESMQYKMVADVTERLDEMNYHLVEIAQHTERRK